MRMCLIAHRFYDGNAHMMQFANALARKGHEVDVISLRARGMSAEEVIEGVHVYRIQHRDVNERHPIQFFTRIMRFHLRATFLLAWLHLRRPYQLIHVQSVPDFLVFAALVPRLMGVPVILDLRDLVPELYASKFHLREDSVLMRMLKGIEWMSAAFASHVIIANPLWLDTISRRSAAPEKCSMFWYYPDPQLFYPRSRPIHDKLVMLYPGTLSWHQGVDVAVRAFPRILRELPQAELHIYGLGTMQEELAALIRELKLEDKVFLMPGVPLKQIVEIMSDSDLAIVPKRVSSKFGNEAASTKIPEFMALGVPVVASRTKVESCFFDDSQVRYFESENEEDLARAVISVCRQPELRDRLIANGLKYIRENGWDEGMEVYVRLAERLAGVSGGSAPPGVKGKAQPGRLAERDSFDSRSVASSGAAVQPARRVGQVIEIDYRTDPRWLDFLQAHPRASVYHHPAWLSALEGEYGRKCMTLAYLGQDGRFEGILPLMQTQGVPLAHAIGHAVGRRLSSLPRTPAAGPLWNHEDALVELVRAAMARVDAEPGMQLELKTMTAGLDGIIAGLSCTPWRISYISPLPEVPLPVTAEGSDDVQFGPEEIIRFGNSRNHLTVKRSINKALKYGVCVRQADNIEELRLWYRLYLDTMRENFVPARPRRFFEALWHNCPKEVMQLWLAEYGTGAGRMVGGVLVLRFGRTAIYAFAGGQRKDFYLHANDILHWSAICDSCAAGYKEYDFGEVSEDHPELIRYKKKWGSVEVPGYRYYYPARPVSGVEAASSSVMKDMVRALWRKVPLSATEKVGDWLYRNL